MGIPFLDINEIASIAASPQYSSKTFSISSIALMITHSFGYLSVLKLNRDLEDLVY